LWRVGSRVGRARVGSVDLLMQIPSSDISDNVLGGDKEFENMINLCV
jgi:hypothetical protein